MRRRYRQLGEHAQSRRAVGANGSLIRLANSSFCSVAHVTHAALQLHPDKNRHPKAEMAFKIVSEVPYHTTRVPFPDDFFSLMNSSCIASFVVPLNPRDAFASSTLDWNLHFHDPLQTPASSSYSNQVKFVSQNISKS